MANSIEAQDGRKGAIPRRIMTFFKAEELASQRRRLSGLGLTAFGAGLFGAGINLDGVKVVNEINYQTQTDVPILIVGAVMGITGLLIAKRGGSRLQDPKR